MPKAYPRGRVVSGVVMAVRVFVANNPVTTVVRCPVCGSTDPGALIFRPYCCGNCYENRVQ
jgi:hypothetical protein